MVLVVVVTVVAAAAAAAVVATKLRKYCVLFNLTYLPRTPVVGMYQICKYYPFVSHSRHCAHGVQTSQMPQCWKPTNISMRKLPYLPSNARRGVRIFWNILYKGFEESVKPTYIWPVDSTSTVDGILDSHTGLSL